MSIAWATWFSALLMARFADSTVSLCIHASSLANSPKLRLSGGCFNPSALSVSFLRIGLGSKTDFCLNYQFWHKSSLRYCRSTHPTRHALRSGWRCDWRYGWRCGCSWSWELGVYLSSPHISWSEAVLAEAWMEPWLEAPLVNAPRQD